MAEVKDKLRQSGQSLSGGQQQRLCIARTIAIKPEVILLDEPCSALDPISTAKIEELINELSNDYTIAIVTHNMQQARDAPIIRPSCILGISSNLMDREDIHRPSNEAHRTVTLPVVSADHRGAKARVNPRTSRVWDTWTIKPP